jgi:predicted aspartyl protease
MRTRTTLLVAAFCTFASLAQATTRDPVLDADPFAMANLLAAHPRDAATREYLAGAVASSRLQTAPALAHLRAAWSTPGVSGAVAWHALQLAGGVLLRAGRYREAGDLMDRAISEHAAELPPDARSTIEQTRGAAMALRNEPPQTATARGSATLPLMRSKIGLYLAPVEIEGKTRGAVLDTGTSISVLSATAAKELGVHMLTQQASIVSATQAAVQTSMAVADTVRVGSVTLHNVVFLVASDETLAPIGPDTRIDVILGFPVLEALNRLTFRTTDPAKPDSPREVVIGGSVRPQVSNLRFDVFDFYVDVRIGGEPQVLFFDSGATRTGFERRYAAEHPEKLAGLERSTVRVAGAGGVETRQTAIIPATTVVVGNQNVAITGMLIELDGSGADSRYGSLGNDVLWAQGGFTLDFGRLQLSLGPH